MSVKKYYRKGCYSLRCLSALNWGPQLWKCSLIRLEHNSFYSSVDCSQMRTCSLIRLLIYVIKVQTYRRLLIYAQFHASSREELTTHGLVINPELNLVACQRYFCHCRLAEELASDKLHLKYLLTLWALYILSYANPCEYARSEKQHWSLIREQINS